LAKGDIFKCDVCGIVCSVDEICGCSECDIICCGSPMRKTGTRKIAKKKAARKKKRK